MEENEWAFLEKLLPFQSALDSIAGQCVPDIAESLRDGSALATYLRRVTTGEPSKLVVIPQGAGATAIMQQLRSAKA